MSIWDKPVEKERFNFDQVEMIIQELPDKNGKLYTRIDFSFFPVAAANDERMQKATYMIFNNKQFPVSTPWHRGNPEETGSGVQPSISELVKDNKITDGAALNNCYVKRQWRPYRSYKNDDKQYWRDRGEPEKVQTDKKGNEYVTKKYVHFLDVYPDEDTCLAAHDNHYEIDNSAVEESIPGFADEKPIEVANSDTALIFLDGYMPQIKAVLIKCLNNGKVDLEKVGKLLAIDLPEMINLPLDNEKVETLVKEIENLAALSHDEIPF